MFGRLSLAKVAGAAWLRRSTTGLAGLLLGITGWTQDEIDTSVALQTELRQFGAGGRVMHDPSPGAPARWTMRWKTALNAFGITFDGRLSAARQ
ncbi:hypothetical protein [Streptomyces sp. NPDC002671]